MAWSSQKCNVLTSLTVESNASVLLEALALVASPYQRAVVFAHLCALQICELHSKILNSPTSLRLQTTDFLCIISLNDRATSIVSTASALVKDIAIVGRILEVCFGDAGFGGCICNIFSSMRPVWLDRLPSSQEKCEIGTQIRHTQPPPFFNALSLICSIPVDHRKHVLDDSQAHRDTRCRPRKYGAQSILRFTS
jgi:hypothetical protein